MRHTTDLDLQSPPNQGLTGSTLIKLKGALSDLTYDPDQLMGLDPADGKPLLAQYDLVRAASALTIEQISKRRSTGLWRWREVLPVRKWESVAYLGEGSTPLTFARRLGSWMGLTNLQLKREGQNPTGSFKARGMAVAVSRATELGVKHLVAPSAGNAGGALAAYAAAAGTKATVIMPVDAPESNQIEVLVAGANLILVDGLISDCGRLAKAIADKVGGFDLSTMKEPYRVEGKKTMGFEMVEELGWRVPDAIVYPTGGGTGLIALWKAFDELEHMGLIGSTRPRMFSVQAAGCAPIVRAFEEANRFASPWEHAETSAAGIRVPAAIGDFMVLDCLRASGGAAVAVPEHDLRDMRVRMAGLGAGYVSLETAAAVAALPYLLEGGHLDATDRVVVFDTGAGFKSENPAGLRQPLRTGSDPDRWDEVISRISNDS